MKYEAPTNAAPALTIAVRHEHDWPIAGTTAANFLAVSLGILALSVALYAAARCVRVFVAIERATSRHPNERNASR